MQSDELNLFCEELKALYRKHHIQLDEYVDEQTGKTTFYWRHFYTDNAVDITEVTSSVYHGPQPRK